MHRPLLLRTLVKGAATALIVSAVTVYFVKSPYVNQSRFLLLGTFGLFVLFSAVPAPVDPCSRVPAQGRRTEADRVGRRPVGALRSAQEPPQRSLRLQPLEGRRLLRRRSRVLSGGHRGPRRRRRQWSRRAGRHRRCGGHAAAGRAAGGRAGTRAPLLRGLRALRACLARAVHAAARRALRGAGGARAPPAAQRRRAPHQARARRRALLARLSPPCALPMAAIAVAIKLSSPGPLFYCQERVGLRGRTLPLRQVPQHGGRRPRATPPRVRARR